MEATITTTGNKRDGYKITLTLPIEWLDQFSSRMRVGLRGDTLSPIWGNQTQDKALRALMWYVDYAPQTQAIVAQIRDEIRNAKVALKEDVEIDHRETIDL